MTAEIQKIGVNVNQITKRVNATGSVYQEDIEEIKGVLAEKMCRRDSSKSTIQENKGFNRTVISITSWEFHPGMVLMQPYPLPATLLTLGLWL